VVRKHCTLGAFENKPFATWKRAMISTGDNNQKSLRCEGVVHKFFEFEFFEKMPVIVMTNCQHNEVNSFHQRYLKETGEFEYNKLDDDLVESIIEELAKKLRPHFDGPITINQFLEDKKGRLGVRYSKAYNDLFSNRRGLREISRMTAFIKKEKYNDKTKSPRFIMGRDPRFNLLYGLYTTPMEHAFTKLEQVAKGKNFLERGKQFKNLVGGWYLENDFSKFEGSQRIEILSYELRLFEKLLSKADFKNFRAVWLEKLKKRGYTLNGIKFSFQGCRGSGDMDTGLGNTLLNYISMKYFLIKNGVPSERFMVDGDDGLAGVPRDKDDYINTFSDFGFDAKLILKKDYHDVDFCSSKFIQIQHGVYYQVQNLDKLLTNIGTVLDEKFASSAAEYYASLGYMYQVVYKQIPVYQQLGDYLRRFHDGKHYVSPNIMTHNYGIKEAFVNSKNMSFEVNHELAYLEVMLTSGKSPIELESLCKQFSAKAVLDERYTRKLKTTPSKPVVREQLVDPYTLVNINDRSKIIFEEDNEWILYIGFVRKFNRVKD